MKPPVLQRRGRPHNVAYRRDALWLAALVHRLSGLALAAFLPLHFLALGLALEGEARLDRFLAWSANPWVKVSEAVLIFALVVHALGGLRLLAAEGLAWRGGQRGLAIGAGLVAAALALVYLVFAH